MQFSLPSSTYGRALFSDRGQQNAEQQYGEHSTELPIKMRDSQK